MVPLHPSGAYAEHLFASVCICDLQRPFLLPRTCISNLLCDWFPCMWNAGVRSQVSCVLFLNITCEQTSLVTKMLLPVPPSCLSCVFAGGHLFQQFSPLLMCRVSFVLQLLPVYFSLR